MVSAATGSVAMGSAATGSKATRFVAIVAGIPGSTVGGRVARAGRRVRLAPNRYTLHPNVRDRGSCRACPRARKGEGKGRGIRIIQYLGKDNKGGVEVQAEGRAPQQSGS